MDLRLQKRLAAQILKCSPKKVKIDPANYEEVKEAITKFDVRNIINKGLIVRDRPNFASRGRARELKAQKALGRRRGHGSRKGTRQAREGKKEVWIAKVRAQRRFLNGLRDGSKIDGKTFRMLYLKSKSGFFKSRRHISIYLEKHGLIK